MLHTAIPPDSAYAEAQPPPPPLVMLVSVTDLHPPKFRTLTMHEDIPDNFERATSPPAAIAKDPRPALGKASKVLAFATPTPINVNPVPSAPAPTSSSRQSAPPLSPGSPLSAISDDASDTYDSSDSDVTKIPCPKGLTRRTLTKHQTFLPDLNDDVRDAEIAKMTVRLARHFLFYPTYSLVFHQAHVQKLSRRHLDLAVALTNQPDKVAVKRVFSGVSCIFFFPFCSPLQSVDIHLPVHPDEGSVPRAKQIREELACKVPLPSSPQSHE